MLMKQLTDLTELEKEMDALQVEMNVLSEMLRSAIDENARMIQNQEEYTQRYSFAVSALTWDGNEYLEKIRDNCRWRKIKTILVQKGLPFTIDMVKSVADAFITAAAEGVTKGILDGGI